MSGKIERDMYIKNWAKFQHFKDRTPPWVKLYRDLLDDPDWHELDGDNAKTLVMLWLIASESDEHNGALPDIRKLSFRLRIKESQLKQQLTKLSHWVVQDDINVISDRYQDDAPETERETETETERETETKKNSNRGSRLPATWVPEKDLEQWAKTERPDLDVQKVLLEFRDYWIAQPGQKGVKLNWDATYRNWIRNQKAVRSFAQADVARATTPSRQGPDPVLARIEEERKLAVPMPASIRRQIEVLRKA